MKEEHVRKPNLKRYFASVIGSADFVYSGGSTYGGGAISGEVS